MAHHVTIEMWLTINFIPFSLKIKPRICVYFLTTLVKMYQKHDYSYTVLKSKQEMANSLLASKAVFVAQLMFGILM